MSNNRQTINSAQAMAGLPQPVVGASTCGIYVDSTSGNGLGYEVFVNGNLYTSSTGTVQVPGTSGNALWECADNGIVLEGNQISGGISAGNIFNVFLRTFFSDGTSLDSPVYSFTVPGTFPSCAAATPVPVAPAKTKKH